MEEKKKADIEFEKGNPSGAYAEYLRCLQIFGISLPASRFESFTSTGWQFARLFFHRIWIGKWLSRKAGGLFCSDPVRSEALISARELSLVFHRLNQLHLATKMNDSHGLMMSLYAINMAETSTTIMNSSDLIDIYMTAALRVKRSYPKYLQFFARYYVNKAKQESSKLCEQIRKFQWIFTPYGYRFFIRHNFLYDANSNESLFTTMGNKSDPMTYVTKEYREYLIYKGVQCLVGSIRAKQEPSVEQESQQKTESIPSAPNIRSGSLFSDVLNYTILLNDTMSREENNTNKDELAQWWSSLLSVAAYWLLEEDEQARYLYDIIGNVPKKLTTGGESLPSALYTIFKAKSQLLTSESLDKFEVYQLCNKSSVLLQDSLTCNKIKPVNSMKLLFQLLTCDWILETRTTLWEADYTSYDEIGYCQVPDEILEKFQIDLNSLRIIAEDMPSCQSRIYLYEAVCRLMAGAAPGPTQQLLDRSLRHRYSRSSIICGGKDRNQQYEGGDRERASAMYVACKYLPSVLLSSPGERAGMLCEAAKMLEKIGDKRKLKDCYQLMKSIGNGSVTN